MNFIHLKELQHILVFIQKITKLPNIYVYLHIYYFLSLISMLCCYLTLEIDVSTCLCHGVPMYNIRNLIQDMFIDLIITYVQQITKKA